MLLVLGPHIENHCLQLAWVFVPGSQECPKTGALVSAAESVDAWKSWNPSCLQYSPNRVHPAGFKLSCLSCAKDTLEDRGCAELRNACLSMLLPSSSASCFWQVFKAVQSELPASHQDLRSCSFSFCLWLSHWRLRLSSLELSQVTIFSPSQIVPETSPRKLSTE